MQSEVISISLPGGLLRGLEWNRAAEQKILMIHGWLDNCETFYRLAPLLAQKYHVVAIDMSGHGQSFHRQGIYGYQNYDYQVDTRLLVQQLGWKKFTFVCHSMGATIAAIYAALWPEEVETIHLSDAYLPVTAEPDTVVDRYRMYINQLMRSHKKAKRTFSELEDAVRIRHDATPDLPVEACERIVRRNLQELEGGGYQWSFDEKLKLPSPLRLTFEHLKVFDNQLYLPVHIYLGTKSPYNEFHPILHKFVDHKSNFHIFEYETGHYPHVERPEDIAGKILNF